MFFGILGRLSFNYGPEGQGFESLIACHKKPLDSLRIGRFLVLFGALRKHGKKWGKQKR